jgi:hypothetical protein
MGVTERDELDRPFGDPSNGLLEERAEVQIGLELSACPAGDSDSVAQRVLPGHQEGEGCAVVCSFGVGVLA